jgi:hypothetical protein
MVDALFLQVECSPDRQGEAAPARFGLGRRQLEVAEVLDRWLADDTRYFKVRAADGAIYILRHAVREGRWELTLFDSGVREETRLSST